tara:strand:+ start:125109 stop:125633 length:525 start_codon:yes stop_codon:yes gene_type:complete
MPHTYKSRRAITLAETVISMLLVGFVIVSTLSIVGPIARSTTVHADRLIAANLANELSEEIASKLWTSPINDDIDFIGPGAGETRLTYDDIDDFHGWSSSPPKNSYNGPYSTMKEWTRSVKVAHVLLEDPTIESKTYTGLKRVIVTVNKNGTDLASISTYHTQAADALSFVVGP